jgi:hypothetical protein
VGTEVLLDCFDPPAAPVVFPLAECVGDVVAAEVGGL